MKYLMNQSISLLVFIFASLYSISAASAPGEIKNRPLFLGFSVQPNIYFVVDDSGSMGWGVTKTTAAKNDYPYDSSYQFTYPVCYTYYNGNWQSVTIDEVPNCPSDRMYQVTTGGQELYEDRDDIDFTPNKATDYWNFQYDIYDEDAFYASTNIIDEQGYYDEELLESCSGYNATAYDPTQTYTPWVGYAESNASVGSHGYIPWIDQDGDGQFDAGECSTRYADRVLYSSLSTDQKQNYRNWYSYYRERTRVAKKAISEVVETSDARMGLATINRGQYYAVNDMGVDSNKEALLDKVFDVPASGGTPLRTALKSAGDYYSGSSSPIQSEDEGGSCQQNYTILMTDGYWNGSSPNVGNVDGSSSNSLIRQSDKDSYSNTLADVAMRYYATDLKTNLADEVPTIDDVDENPAQHMVTFTVAFGVNGQIGPNDTTSGRETDEDGMPKSPEQSFAWPQPSSNNDSTIDDVRHAAWNGRGLYLNAANPQSLIDSLEASIDEIESRTGTSSALAFNSSSYRTDSKFYFAQFTSGSWAGELIAQELTEDLDVGSVVWRASEELDKKTDGSRVILTYDKNGEKGVGFRQSSLPDEHYADLKALYDSEYNAYYNSETSFIGDAVDYLRGDRSNEGASAGAFRDRSSALGDIINSSPVYVAGPIANFPSFIEEGYITYMRSKSDRDPVIYVGANDGMLHAFDAETGDELFAYVPSGVTSTDADKGLHYLVDQSYNHRYYVDGTPTISDAYINDSWKTLLLGNMGAGGKSIFALDVSDPFSVSESGAASTVLWEVQMDDLGLTFPEVQVTKMNDGTWAAIVANGYHNTLDGKAKIFILDLSDGSLIKTLDTEYGELTSGDCVDECNGMSDVTLRDVDGNGTTDFIYAGDLKGNIWAVNVYSNKQSEWVFDSQVSYSSDGIITGYSGSSVEPIFVTEGRRPLTTSLIVTSNPQSYGQKTWPNQLLFFGTGQFIAEGDHGTTDAEYVYGVMHSNGQYELSINDDAKLFAKRTIEEQTISSGGETLVVRSVESDKEDEVVFEYGYEVNPSGVQQKMGWYLELPASGERVVHDALQLLDYVVFNTLMPESDPCAFGASGFLMALSIVYGTNPEIAILDFNNDGIIDSDDDDLAGYELDSPPAGLTKLGSQGLGQSTFEEPKINDLNLYGGLPKRVSWEELR